MSEHPPTSVTPAESVHTPHTRPHGSHTDTRRGILSKLAAGGALLALGRFTPVLAAATPAAKAWVKGMSLDVTFRISPAPGMRPAKRPYVAVWIEDAQGNSVRTLTVWVQQNRMNPRWLAELRRWMRQNSDLLSTVSSATRNPGTYAVAWDGKTDRGTQAAQGEYHVCIETAREHGPYSLVREKVTVGTSAFRKALSAQGDIASASVNYAKA